MAELKNAEILGKNDVELTIQVGEKTEKIRLREYLGWTPETVSDELRDHSAKETFLGVLAAGEKRVLNEFLEIDYSKYMAHCRKYAKWVLKGRGDKRPTIQDIQDIVMEAFSEDTVKDIKEGFMMEAARGAELVTDDDLAKGLGKDLLREFKKGMYKYEEGEEKVCYEDAVRTLKAFEENRDITKYLIDALTNRGHAVREATKDERAKLTTIEPGYLADSLAANTKFVDSVVEKVRRVLNRDYPEDREAGGGGVER